jgi:hypothetical protein
MLSTSKPRSLEELVCDIFCSDQSGIGSCLAIGSPHTDAAGGRPKTFRDRDVRWDGNATAGRVRGTRLSPARGTNIIELGRFR